jgi:hypothetical protein
LAESVRSDIRRSVDATLPDEKTLLIAVAGGGQIRYEADQSGCRRNATGPADVGPATDLFAIGRAESWRLERGETGIRPLLVANLELKPDRGAAPPAPIVVCAGLGADLPDE